MDEFIYICYTFETEISAAIVDTVSAVIDTHADDEHLSVNERISGPEMADGTDQPVTFTVDGLEYEFGVGSPDVGNLDDEQLVWIRVFGTHFQAPNAGTEAARENTEMLIRFVVSIYEALAEQDHPVSYVYGFGPTEVQMLLDSAIEIPDEQLSGDGVAALFWLQILPPARVSEIGSDRLLSAPAWRVEQLSDGSMLLIVYDTPDPWVDGDSSLLGDVMDHLDLEDPHEG